MIGILFLSVIFLSAGALAQQKKGEIINVNYKYKIAFTDLAEGDVRFGDMVSVILPEGREILLNVVEAYPVMAKLAVSADPAQSVTDDDFAKITVGSGVRLFEKIKPRDVVSPSQPVRQDQAAMNSPIEMKIFSEKNVNSGIVVKPEAASVTAVRSINVDTWPSVQENTVGVDKNVERLIENAIKLSEHLTRLLTEKDNLVVELKAKNALAGSAVKKADDLAALNITLTSQVKALQLEVNRLQSLNSDGEKKITDLGQKLSEVKKKLSRMVEIVNKNLKNYE